MNERAIIFVGGLHRSGTSLLATLLAEHPDIGGLTSTSVIEGEGQYLQDTLPLEQHYGGPGRFAFYKDYRRMPTNETGREVAQRLQAAWAPYWPPDTMYVLEKTPGNIVRAQLLRHAFPSARFIFIIRHPVATALATQKWSHTGLFALIYHWLVAYDYLADVCWDGSHYMVVPYEELVSKTSLVLDQVHDFLGLQRNSTQATRVGDRNQRYFDRWQAICSSREALKAQQQRGLAYSLLHKVKVFMKATAGAQGYQVSILRAEADDAIAAFEERVNAHGYSLTDLRRCPPVRVAGCRQGL